MAAAALVCRWRRRRRRGWRTQERKRERCCYALSRPNSAFPEPQAAHSPACALPGAPCCRAGAANPRSESGNSSEEYRRRRLRGKGTAAKPWRPPLMTTAPGQPSFVQAFNPAFSSPSSIPFTKSHVRSDTSQQQNDRSVRDTMDP